MYYLRKQCKGNIFRMCLWSLGFVEKLLEISLHEGLYPGDKCNHGVYFIKSHTNRVGLALPASCA